jgi:diguanylate cyclase (GGDEF)-like protein
MHDVTETTADPSASADEQRPSLEPSSELAGDPRERAGEAWDGLRALAERRDTVLRAVIQELRDPLATVAGFAELLVDYSDSAELVRELGGELIREAHRLEGLARQLTEIASAPRREPTGATGEAESPANESDRLRASLAEAEQQRRALETRLAEAHQAQQQLQAYADDFRRTYTESRLRLQRLLALYEVSTAISSTADPDEVLERSAAGLARLLPESAVDLYVVDESSKVNVWRTGIRLEALPEAEPEVRDSAQPVGRCLAVGISVLEAEPGGVTSLAVPLVAGQLVLGAVLLRRAGSGISDEERQVAEMVANQVALALLHARLATTDGETGLFNKRHFLRTLELECERARRGERSLGLLMIDIDHFKRYNDEHGHPAGDAVLRQVAAMIARTFRRTDLPARYGGEEFAVILPDQDERTTAVAGERLRRTIEALAQPVFDGRQLAPVTISVGAVALPGQETTPERLIQMADLALLRAKRNGRNRVEIEFWQPPTDQAEAASEGTPSNDAPAPQHPPEALE